MERGRKWSEKRMDFNIVNWFGNGTERGYGMKKSRYVVKKEWNRK